MNEDQNYEYGYYEEDEYDQDEESLFELECREAYESVMYPDTDVFDVYDNPAFF